MENRMLGVVSAEEMEKARSELARVRGEKFFGQSKADFLAMADYARKGFEQQPEANHIRIYEGVVDGARHLYVCLGTKDGRDLPLYTDENGRAMVGQWVRECPPWCDFE